MPRGRKAALTLDEQLTKVTEDIENTEKDLKMLKEKKNELEQQIKYQKLEELSSLIDSSGKSIDEIREMISA